MTDTDVPQEWREHYGAFVSFGDAMVIATCRRCFALVNSDSFEFHNTWHTNQTQLMTGIPRVIGG